MARRTSSRLSGRIPSIPTFTPFNSLPLDIQNRIWTYSCEEYGRSHARVQRIAKDPRPKRTNAKPPSRTVSLRILAPKRYPVPSLLHTCQKSRALAMIHWTLWPCANPNRPRKNDGTFIYVNKAHDTIYFADGHIDDFLFLRCISRAPPPDSGLPSNEWSATHLEFGLFLKGVRHYALDWWCWLVGSVDGDSLWMSLLCIASNEDLTIVINPLGSVPDFDAGAAQTPTMKEIVPGTTRSKTVDIMLRHIQSAPDLLGDANVADVLDTQVFKQGWTACEEPYREYMPNLKALAVIWPGSGVDQEDEGNGMNDERYLDEVRSQCRYHRLKFTLESMSFEQEDLRKQMKDGGIAFPNFSISMCGGNRYG